MKFFVGLDDVVSARRFEYCFVSISRLRNRRSDFQVGRWILDSGAFSELSIHGKYRQSVYEYARQINRWRGCGIMLAAVSQDYMCEPFIIEKTGLDVQMHQDLTIARYLAIRANSKAYVMPVLQGFKPQEYVSHVRQYGDYLKEGAWVGVGSICKRNNHPQVIEYILQSIKNERPDLRLHGFGLKLTALRHPRIVSLLHSADSMAWSFAARYEGRNAHDWQEAENYRLKVTTPIMGNEHLELC